MADRPALRMTRLPGSLPPPSPGTSVTRQICLGLGLSLGVMLAQPTMAAGPAPIDLKSCAHFAILAYSTITSTGAGTINGDVGLSPAGAIDLGTPPAQVNGTIYNGGPVAAQAQLDLNDAIIASSPAQLAGGLNVGAELGGLELIPGVYASPSGAYDITLADLTLNGNPDDVWVFQMASTLTVGVGRRLVLMGGAQARNIFWQVGSSATLQTSCEFKGTILAYASITMNADSVLDGRALAQTGAVTFNGLIGSVPVPEAPVFIDISRTTGTNAVEVVLVIPPFFPLTLESCPALSATNWTTVMTDTPTASPWTFTDYTAIIATTTQRFYRAYITAY
jgi:hypothetical protein